MATKELKKFADYIKMKLLTDQRWLERGILAIFERQTALEKEAEATVAHNKIGFSGYDARRLSYYAKWLLRGNHLSGRHLEIAKRKMVKYALQLAKIANQKKVEKNVYKTEN